MLDHFKNDKTCIALYFLPASASNPQLYFSIYGRLKRLHLSTTEIAQLQRRDEFKKKVSIQNINRIPAIIQKEFKPQMGLLQAENTPGESVLTIQTFNHIDNMWDYIYLLINQDIINSINSKLKASGLLISIDLGWQVNVKSYFSLIYPVLSSFSKIEFDKLAYTKDLINTLERSILYNQELLLEIELLKQKKENSIIESIRELAFEESKKLGKEVEISKNTFDYILNYKGNEQKLKVAFIKAVGIANLIAIAKNNNELLVEPEFIQVNEGSGKHINTRLNPKRVEKAENILQRYEEAAQRAQNVGKRITINSIAHHVLPKSISAPAISDSIKKYKTEILYLLDIKKSDWLILRTYFSPIVSFAKRPISQPRG